MNQAVLEVCDRELYAPEETLYAGKDRTPAVNGALDLRLGISAKVGFCETCGESLVQCNGHFGFVRLALPAFHIGYLRMVINVLQNICKVTFLLPLSCTMLRTAGLFAGPPSRKRATILSPGLAPPEYRQLTTDSDMQENKCRMPQSQNLLSMWINKWSGQKGRSTSVEDHS